MQIEIEVTVRQNQFYDKQEVQKTATFGYESEDVTPEPVHNAMISAASTLAYNLIKHAVCERANIELAAILREAENTEEEDAT